MTFCVVGGGKMGLSHLALITPYVGKNSVVLVEQKRTVRLVFKMMGYKTFASLDDVVARLGKPTGVIIATPTSSHATLAEWAISNCIPFFVEKPLTLHVEISASLVKQANEAAVTAQTGFVMRYVATFQRLRSLIEAGSLGRLHRYRASMLGNVMTKTPKPGNWQGDFKRGGGVLNEYGPHLIDLCRFIFGDVKAVQNANFGMIKCSSADDWIDVSWIHQTGVEGTLQVNWCDTSKRKSVIEIEADFEEAFVRADNSALTITFKEDTEIDSDTQFKINCPIQPKNVGFFLRGEEFSLEMEDFLASCLDSSSSMSPGHPEGVTPSLYDGYVVDQLIDIIAGRAGLR